MKVYYNIKINNLSIKKIIEEGEIFLIIIEENQT